MVDFLLIGPETVVQYNNCFRLIRDHKMFYGFKRDRGHMVFDYIEGYEIDVNQIRWFQNLIDVPPDPLVLRKVYEDGDYRRFYDYWICKSKYKRTEPRPTTCRTTKIYR